MIYHNLLYVDEDLTGILDFDDCKTGYLLEDISKSLVRYIEDPAISVLGAGRDNFNAFLDSYSRYRPLSDKDVNNLRFFALTQALDILYRFKTLELKGTPKKSVSLESFIGRLRQNSYLLP